MGGFRESRPKKFLEAELCLQLNNFKQKLDFDVLWFKKRAHKIKEEKKRKKPHGDQKWVGWDEKVCLDIKPCEKFFVVLKPFLNETAFYAKLLGRFSGSKAEVTRLIALKFGIKMQLINLKLLSKFHVARPNGSRVMSKSLKSHTR